MKSKKGFILQEALISVLILSVSVLLVFEGMRVQERACGTIKNTIQQIQDEIELNLSDRKECIPCANLDSVEETEEEREDS